MRAASRSPSSAVFKLCDRDAIPNKRLVCRIVVADAVSIASTTIDKPIGSPSRRWGPTDLIGHWYPPLTATLMAVDEIGFHARPLPERLVLGREAAALRDKVPVVACDHRRAACLYHL